MAEGSGGLRQGLVWGAIAFGITLATIIGLRLDRAALTVVVGVACGVGASIPTGLLVVFLLRRRDLAKEKREVAGSPPVVVVTAPMAAGQLPAPTTWPGGYPAPLPAPREFAVIGEEELEERFDYW